MNDEQEKKDVAQDECTHKCQEYLDGWKRALADYDNLQKQMSEEKQNSQVYARVQMAKDLLPVIDSFDQAMKFAPVDPDGKDAFLSGIQNIRTQFEEALKKSQITAYAEVGETFDPYLHEAVAQQIEEGKEDEEILQVISRGWKCGDQVIRAAKVIVNKS